MLLSKYLACMLVCKNQTNNQLTMFVLLLKFEIPKSKLYEFDLAIGRLIKWPVYSLHASSTDPNKKSFSFIREWNSKEDMQNDLESQIFTNLIGVIKVLGNVILYDIYNANKVTNEFLINN